MSGRSQWPRGLRRESAAARLLILWDGVPSVSWTAVSGECCVLSGRDLCIGLITRTEESYRLVCVCECDREAPITRGTWPTGGCWAVMCVCVCGGGGGARGSPGGRPFFGEIFLGVTV